MYSVDDLNLNSLWTEIVTNDVQTHYRSISGKTRISSAAEPLSTWRRCLAHITFDWMPFLLMEMFLCGHPNLRLIVM